MILASRTGWPVSTTHAMTGAIVGAAIAAVGLDGVRWSLLLTTVALPLAASPVVSGLLAYVLHRVSAEALARASRYCVCVENHAPVSVRLRQAVSGITLVDVPPLVLGPAATCDDAATTRVSVTDAAHWGTSAALSFARGLNDTPKIVGLGVGAAVTGSWVFLAAAAAMGLGSFVYGRRVTATLAERVTGIDRLEGLSASAVSSSLVLLASFVALPVSTTHVSAGAIIGAGLRGGFDAIRWQTVAHLIVAWVITLPVAGTLAAGVSLLLRS